MTQVLNSASIHNALSFLENDPKLGSKKFLYDEHANECDYIVELKKNGQLDVQRKEGSRIPGRSKFYDKLATFFSNLFGINSTHKKILNALSEYRENKKSEIIQQIKKFINDDISFDKHYIGKSLQLLELAVKGEKINDFDEDRDFNEKLEDKSNLNKRANENTYGDHHKNGYLKNKADKLQEIVEAVDKFKFGPMFQFDEVQKNKVSKVIGDLKTFVGAISGIKYDENIKKNAERNIDDKNDRLLKKFLSEEEHQELTNLINGMVASETEEGRNARLDQEKEFIEKIKKEKTYESGNKLMLKIDNEDDVEFENFSNIIDGLFNNAKQQSIGIERNKNK